MKDLSKLVKQEYFLGMKIMRGGFIKKYNSEINQKYNELNLNNEFH